MQQKFVLWPALSIAFLVSSIAFSQNQPCAVSAASIVDRSNSVIVERVTLSGAWGSNTATVLQPDRQLVEGAVVFSHSEIDQNGLKAADLLPIALTLAQAGAAVIVPERTLNWPPTDRTMNHDGAVILCAAHWIVDHTKIVNEGKPTTKEGRGIVRWGFAYVGPALCDPHDSECRFTFPFNDEPQDPQRPGRDRVAVHVLIGEAGEGDSTTQIISDGGLRAAKWLQGRLGLAPIRSIVTSSAIGSRF